MMPTLRQRDVVGVENRTSSLYRAVYSSDFFTNAIAVLIAIASMTNSSSTEGTTLFTSLTYLRL